MANTQSAGAPAQLASSAVSDPGCPEQQSRQLSVVPGADSAPDRGRATDEAQTGRAGIPIETDYYIVPGTGGHGRARADALLEVVQVFGCRVAVFGYDATRNDKFLVMVGTRSVLDALGILLSTVAVRMERAARAAVASYAQRVREALPQMATAAQRRVLVTPFFREYLRGYGIGVAEKVRALRAETIAAGGAELAAILAQDQFSAEEIFNRDFPDRKPLRKERRSHTAARQAGVDAGRKADIGDWYIARHDLVFAMI